jgi:hypothetical protein
MENLIKKVLKKKKEFEQSARADKVKERPVQIKGAVEGLGEFFVKIDELIKTTDSSDHHKLFKTAIEQYRKNTDCKSEFSYSHVSRTLTMKILD